MLQIKVEEWITFEKNCQERFPGAYVQALFIFPDFPLALTKDSVGWLADSLSFLCILKLC